MTSSAFPRISLDDPSGGRVEIYLHGGQVMSWIDGAGREHLYLSRRARFEAGESIRGGIPVVFPQFAGNGPLPKHGLIRTREWAVERQDSASATLSIGDDAETRALWPHRFLAELLVSVAGSLEIALRITNTDASPFLFAAALHTYFAVDEVEDAAVTGLTGCPYFDTVNDWAEVVDDDPAIGIHGETDRVYAHAPPNVRLGGSGGRVLDLETEGFGDWVVWNPWAELTATLTDMEPQDYRRMLCVEAARIVDPVTLGPGETWTGVQVMRPGSGSSKKAT